MAVVMTMDAANHREVGSKGSETTTNNCERTIPRSDRMGRVIVAKRVCAARTIRSANERWINADSRLICEGKDFCVTIHARILRRRLL